jgi:hypothetical protein
LSHRLRAPVSFAIAALLLLTGCRYLPVAGDSPAGVVTAAYDAVEAAGVGGYERFTDFACAAQADDVLALLGENAASLSMVTAAGLDPKEVLAGTSVDFENLKVTESKKTETAATVRVTGKATHTFAEGPFRTMMTKVLKHQGIEPTKKRLDATMAAFADKMTKSAKMKVDMTLIQEDGKWVICSAG